MDNRVSPDPALWLPEVPLELEQVVFVSGGRFLDQMIRSGGGILECSQRMSIAPQTTSRWVHRPPGVVFGAPRTTGCYRSLWHGYPPPFPALDRVLEELVGDGESYLRRLVGQEGWKSAYDRLLSSDGFGVECLGFLESEFGEACRAVQIPRTSGKRLWRHCRYPQQWRALDRLCIWLLGDRFLRSLLMSGSCAVRRPVPFEALQCLLAEVRQGTFDGIDGSGCVD